MNVSYIQELSFKYLTGITIKYYLDTIRAVQSILEFHNPDCVSFYCLNTISDGYLVRLAQEPLCT
jgi:Fe-S cluster assembly iron-binding protein IscA